MYTVIDIQPRRGANLRSLLLAVAVARCRSYSMVGRQAGVGKSWLNPEKKQNLRRTYGVRGLRRLPTDTLPFSFSFSPREEDSCACFFPFLFGKIPPWNDYRFATLALLVRGKNARGTKPRRDGTFQFPPLTESYLHTRGARSGEISARKMDGQ